MPEHWERLENLQGFQKEVLGACQALGSSSWGKSCSEPSAPASPGLCPSVLQLPAGQKAKKNKINKNQGIAFSASFWFLASGSALLLLEDCCTEQKTF